MLIVCSSLDLAVMYEEAKAAQDKATDASQANYTKKRSMLTEVRHFKEQRDEVRQWEKLQNAKACHWRSRVPSLMVR